MSHFGSNERIPRPLSCLVFLFLFGCAFANERVSLPAEALAGRYLYDCGDSGNFEVRILKREEDSSGLQEREILRHGIFKERVLVPSKIQGLTMLYTHKELVGHSYQMRIHGVTDFPKSNLKVGKRYKLKGLSLDSMGHPVRRWLTEIAVEKVDMAGREVSIKEEGKILALDGSVEREYSVRRGVSLETGFNSFFEYRSLKENTKCSLIFFKRKL